MTNTELREKLVEIIRNTSLIFEGSGIELLRCSVKQKMVNAIADALIANGVTFAKDTNAPTKWISVKDRLPEGANVTDVAENVIAYLNNGNGDGQVCTGWLCDKTWWLIVGQDDEHTQWEMGDVSHWMPLPEPPKED